MTNVIRNLGLGLGLLPSVICLSETELLQSPFSHDSGRSLAWNHVCGDIDHPCGVIANFCVVINDPCGVIADPCGVIANPCGVIENPCGIVVIPEAIGDRRSLRDSLNIIKYC